MVAVGCVIIVSWSWLLCIMAETVKVILSASKESCVRFLSDRFRLARNDSEKSARRTKSHRVAQRLSRSLSSVTAPSVGPHPAEPCRIEVAIRRGRGSNGPRLGRCRRTSFPVVLRSSLYSPGRQGHPAAVSLPLSFRSDATALIPRRNHDEHERRSSAAVASPRGVSPSPQRQSYATGGRSDAYHCE